MKTETNNDQKFFVCKDCGKKEPQGDYSIDASVVCRACEEKKERCGTLITNDGLEVKIHKTSLPRFLGVPSSAVTISRVVTRGEEGKMDVKEYVKKRGKIIGRWFEPI